MEEEVTVFQCKYCGAEHLCRFGKECDSRDGMVCACYVTGHCFEHCPNCSELARGVYKAIKNWIKALNPSTNEKEEELLMKAIAYIEDSTGYLKDRHNKRRTKYE